MPREIKVKTSIADNTKLISEWNYSKNLNIDPKNISVWDKKKYWWLEAATKII